MNETSAPARVDRLNAPVMTIRQDNEGVEVTHDGSVVRPCCADASLLERRGHKHPHENLESSRSPRLAGMVGTVLPVVPWHEDYTLARRPSQLGSHGT